MADSASHESVDILDLVDEPDPAYNWVVPSVLARRDRLILTGEEGYGKSTFLRQFGVQVAAGIHPFTLDEIEPMRVVLLDVENSREQVRDESVRLARSAGARLKRGQFTYLIRSEGLNLRLLPDIDWLRRRLDLVQPDLLIAGPHYKLGSGDPIQEEVGLAVATAIDSIRSEFDVAFILEAHCPHAQNGQERVKRPYGWSGWVRWPEFGKHLGRDGRFEKWRGDRATRTWPFAFEWGEEWPWVVIGDASAERFAAAVEYAERLGCLPSERELAQHLGVAKSTVHRLLSSHHEAWEHLFVA